MIGDDTDGDGIECRKIRGHVQSKAEGTSLYTARTGVVINPERTDILSKHDTIVTNASEPGKFQQEISESPMISSCKNWVVSLISSQF